MHRSISLYSAYAEKTLFMIFNRLGGDDCNILFNGRTERVDKYADFEW